MKPSPTGALRRQDLSSLDRYEVLDVFGFAFQLTNLLTLLFFSLLFMLACAWALLPAMWVRGIGTWVTAVMLFMHYGFIVVEYSARGYRRVPKITGEMVFPSHSAKPWKVAVIVALSVTTWFAIKDVLGIGPAIVLVMLVFPVALATIAITDRLGWALTPWHWVATIRGLGFGPAALKMYTLQALALGVLLLAVRNVPIAGGIHLAWVVPLVLYLVLTWLRSLGVLLNTRAEELGMAVSRSESLEQRRQEEAARLERAEFVTALHKLARADKLKEAWARLDSHLQRTAWEEEALYLAELRAWDDPRLGQRLAQGYIDRLVAMGDLGVAWDVYRWCCDNADGEFVLRSGGSTLALARAALTPVQRRCILPALEHFHVDFPNHPHAGDAAALCIEAWIDLDLVISRASQFDNLLGAHPALSESSSARHFRRLLKH